MHKLFSLAALAAILAAPVSAGTITYDLGSLSARTNLIEQWEPGAETSPVARTTTTDLALPAFDEALGELQSVSISWSGMRELRYSLSAYRARTAFSGSASQRMVFDAASSLALILGDAPSVLGDFERSIRRSCTTSRSSQFCSTGNSAFVRPEDIELSATFGPAEMPWTEGGAILRLSQEVGMTPDPADRTRMSGYIALDETGNVSLTYTYADLAAVPLPATSVLLIAGLGAIGATGRRRAGRA